MLGVTCPVVSDGGGIPHPTENPMPLYQTQEDLLNEKSVCKHLSTLWDLKIYKLHPALKVDLALVRGTTIEGFMEVKCRTYTMQRLEELGGFFTSLVKWREAQDMCQAARIPYHVVVRDGEGVIWHSKDPCPSHIVMGGRYDRNDPRDIEPMAVIPMSQFSKT